MVEWPQEQIKISSFFIALFMIQYVRWSFLIYFNFFLLVRRDVHAVRCLGYAAPDFCNSVCIDVVSDELLITAWKESF